MKHDFHDREDGLQHCKVCKGGEDELPKECPGVEMTGEQMDRVSNFELQYFNGRWWIDLELHKLFLGVK